jgi:hypothetical protein
MSEGGPALLSCRLAIRDYSSSVPLSLGLSETLRRDRIVPKALLSMTPGCR